MDCLYPEEMLFAQRQKKVVENKFLKLYHQNASEPELPSTLSSALLTVSLRQQHFFQGWFQSSESHNCSICHLFQGKPVTATQLVQVPPAEASPLTFF